MRGSGESEGGDECERTSAHSAHRAGVLRSDGEILGANRMEYEQPSLEASRRHSDLWLG